MRKIINGKMYDTETAKLIDSFSNDLHYLDFGWMAENLYQKRTGEFFLYGQGGGLTKYAHHFENGCMCDGEKIIPISEAEAKEWVEQNCDVDTYIEVFGEPEE